MSKYVLIPDSFKGTLSSVEICNIAKGVIEQIDSESEIVLVPVADGGEGSVDCFLSALGGEKVSINCKNPYMEDICASYGCLPDGKTAVVEMAAAAGLPMVEQRKDPLSTTTYGVGELILHAAKNGAKHIIVGLGGSCTNDFGCGAAYACGVRFYDKQGKSFMPVGKTLCDVERIDLSQKAQILKSVEIVTMCDIDNPPYGPDGAARVFAPQKGADKSAVELLDSGVAHLCDLVQKQLGRDISKLSGGGAAGAMGAGMVVFFDSVLKAGIEVVLETVDFSNVIKGADMIVTGEGKMDSQSLRGKVVIGVARAAKQSNVPVISIVGGAEDGIADAYGQGVTAIFPINRLPQDFSVSRHHSAQNLAFTVENVMRFFDAYKKRKM